MARALIVLAAGQGTRMNSDMPKVLHKLAGLTLLEHSLKAAAELKVDCTVIITGPDMPSLEAKAAELEATTVLQTERLGTGHAVLAAEKALADFDGEVIILLGDTPVMNQTTVPEMSAALASADLVALGFPTADPTNYGRFVMDGDQLTRIVEHKDATDEERMITLCNSGVFAAQKSTLYDLCHAIKNENSQSEYYLTDIVEIANTKGLTTHAVKVPQGECGGINSRAELAEAEARFQTTARQNAMRDGVTLQAPETVFFSHDTHLGRDVLVEPNVIFAPGVTVESDAHIRAFSHLEDAHVGARAVVGPYARLRPGTELGNDTKIGNFVEIKTADIGEGAKVNHLTYVGDATIGARTNIGAGTVVCNYDGVMKHRTEVGEDVFIGSNTLLVSPVKVGDAAMTATGSVISTDVPDGALAIARARQENKPGLAVKLFQKLRAQKARKVKKDS